MRNLKKILSGLLVGATVASSIVPAFAATSYTYETQAKALYDLGLFKGVATEPGVYNPDLGASMDRETGVVMMLRLIGKIDEANAISDSQASSVLAKYSDASKIDDWAKKAVAYAVEKGLVIGTTDTTVGPKEQFIGKMYAAIILRNVGYQITVANYDTSSSMMAEKGGLTATEAVKFNEKNLIRDDMVGMSYGSLNLQYQATAKTIIETLVANGKVDKALAVSLGLIKEVTQAMTVTQSGAKTFTVKFNNAIDPAKLVVAVKKGAITLNASKVTPAADNKSVTVEMATTITSDDYAITVTGAATDALTATVAAAEQKVSKVEFSSDKLVLDRTDAKVVTVGYKVSNQFGEDITDISDIQFTAGKGTIVAADGELTITALTEFEAGEKVSVSAIHVATSTFASGIFTVADKAQVADVAISTLYNADGKTLDINSNYSDFWLVVDAKDQYGNSVPAADIGNDVIVASSNTAIATVSGFAKETINDSSKSVLKLVAPATPIAGTTKITVISKTTGKVATFDVVVKDQVKADKISFSAPEFAVAGEKVTVPFTAVDQFGNQITNANSALTSLTPTFSESGITGTFSQDYVKGAPTLTVDATNLTEAKSVVMTVVTTTGNLAQLTIKFAAPAEATVISGIKDVSNTLLLGNTVSMDAEDNIVILDQYGRTMDLDTAKNSVVLTSSDEAKVSVVNSVYEINALNTTISLNAAAKGTSTVTLKIKDAEGTVVAGSAYQKSFKVVEKSDITSYEVADVAPVYYGGTSYAKELKVYGILADGSKVAIPHFTNNVENFKVVYSATGVTFNPTTAKFEADNTVPFATDKSTKDVSVVVTVVGATGTQVFNKTVTVTKDAPKAATLTLATSGTNTVESDTLVSANLADANTQAGLETVVRSILTVKDQYGVAISNPSLTIVATNLPEDKLLDGTGTSALAQGESYNVTVVTNNGKTMNFIIKLK